HPRTWTEKLGLLLAPPALVSENLARDLDNSDPNNRRFKLRWAGRTPEVTRMGTVTFAGSNLPLVDSTVVVMDLHSASAICFPERPGYVHHIAVKLAAGADRQPAHDAIGRVVGDRAAVQTIEGSRQIVADVTAGLEIGFAIGGAGALVVGLFLVYNA